MGQKVHPYGFRLGFNMRGAGETQIELDQRLQRAKLKGAGAHITHMIVLTDARQVNADLISVILAANARVNG